MVALKLRKTINVMYLGASVGQFVCPGLMPNDGGSTKTYVDEKVF